MTCQRFDLARVQNETDIAIQNVSKPTDWTHRVVSSQSKRRNRQKLVFIVSVSSVVFTVFILRYSLHPASIPPLLSPSLVVRSNNNNNNDNDNKSSKMFSNHSYHKMKSDSPPRSKNIEENTLDENNEKKQKLPSKKSSVTMKVKELRNWLSEFGDSNHSSHYHHLPRDNGDTIYKNDDGDDDDMLRIHSKPSTVSTTPSTDIMVDDDDEGDDDDDECFAAVADQTQKGENDDDFNKTERITGENHVHLLQKQAPIMQKEDGYPSSSSSSCTSDHERTNNDRNQPFLSFGQMALTKATLDAMSGNNDYENQNRNGNGKSLGDRLRELDEQPRNEPNTDNDRMSLRRCDSSESSSGGSLDSNSSNIPSIAPGALVSKMATMFLNNNDACRVGAVAEGAPQGAPTMPPIVERRRFVDPKDLTFLHASNSSGSGSGSTNKTKDPHLANLPPPPTTAVGKGIRKFGGPRRTLIERRKEELNQKFGENRSAVFVKRKTWSQKSANGTYQRKTVVDKVYK